MRISGRHLLLGVLIAFITYFIGAFVPMIIDSAKPDPKLPPLAVDLYPVGRFMFPIPKGMGFKMAGSDFEFNKITIKEIPWKNGVSHEEYLRETWLSVRSVERENYEEAASVGPSTQGGWAEQDVSNLCGHPAMLLCYRGRMADHNIDVHIGLPEVLLRLTESRPYDLGEECRDMEGPILDLFKHYRFGRQNVSPDSFFSAAGRFEGVKSWQEQVGVGVRRPADGSKPKIYLALDSASLSAPDEPPKSIKTLVPWAKINGFYLSILRSQKRVLAGMEGLEEVFLGADNYNEEPQLTASWNFQGTGNDPEKPLMEIKLTCPASAEEDALRIWDAVMTNFTTVREYYGRRL
ncbi:MAG TPA: hypothetical protein DGF30_08740 [Desulfomicrobium sp.]|nr:hypothetical protein [Desulfomicrobium sp.]